LQHICILEYIGIIIQLNLFHNNCCNTILYFIIFHNYKVHMSKYSKPSGFEEKASKLPYNHIFSHHL